MVARTFDAKIDAQAWALSPDFDDVEEPPEEAPDPLLRDYAEEFLATRRARGRGPLKPRTVEHYRKLLDAWILPGLGDVRLSQITVRRVDQWYADLDDSKPTMKAHAYSLLHGIMANAVRVDLLKTPNPCRIEGAGQTTSKVEGIVLSVPEVLDLADAMPDRYRTMVLVSVFCGLRFGETTELRRKDVDLGRAVLNVRRGVVRTSEGFIVGTPKAHGGAIEIPAPLVPEIEHHLSRFVADDPEALLFPARGGGHMAPSTLYKPFYRARTAIGRPELRWHDLRHTAGTLTAHQGATLAELQARLRHSTAKAAMRYQHATEDRGRVIADKLGEVYDIEARRRAATA
jgi:integrase